MKVTPFVDTTNKSIKYKNKRTRDRIKHPFEIWNETLLSFICCVNVMYLYLFIFKLNILFRSLDSFRQIIFHTQVFNIHIFHLKLQRSYFNKLFMVWKYLPVFLFIFINAAGQLVHKLSNGMWLITSLLITSMVSFAHNATQLEAMLKVAT